MAYQPISQTKKGGGYTPIGQNKNTFPKSYQDLFPTKQKVQLATASLGTRPQPKQTVSQQRSILNEGSIISQGAPEKTNFFRKAIRAIPGDSKFEKSLEKDFYEPIAKVGRFLAPTTGDIMNTVVKNNPGISQEELQEKVKKEILKSGIPLNIPGQPITSDTKIFSPEIIGMVKKIPGKLIQKFIGAKTEKEALDLVTSLGIKGDERIIKDILNISDDVQAQKFFDDLKSTGVIKQTESLPNLPKVGRDAEVPLQGKGLIPKGKVVTPDTPPTLPKAVRGVDEVTSQRVVPTTTSAEIKPASIQALKEWITVFNRRGMTQEVLDDLSIANIKPRQPITLYRAGDVDNTEFQSWSKVKSKDSDLVTRTFNPEEVLIDTTDPRAVQQLAKVDGIEPDAVKSFNNLESEVIIKPAAMVQREASTEVANKLPALPKLPKNIRQSIETGQADETVQRAIKERYSASARKPVSQDNELAEAAKSATSKGELNRLTGELLTPISSRLERINPELKVQLRKFENSVTQKTHLQNVEIKPLLDATKKMSGEDQALFDLARKNGDSEIIDALSVKYGIQDELNRTRAVMDDIFERAEAVGMDISYRKDYFPRMVKNPQKFLAYLRGRDDWSSIRAAVEAAAEKKGVKYTDMTPEEISGVVNNFIRGYGDKTALANPNFAKGRTLEVLDDELNQFYESSDSALTTYVIRMNDEIEGRKFFGKRPKNTEVEDISAEDSIGAYVFDLIEQGKIKPDQESVVSDILKARFHRGKMNGVLDVYRNAEYISTMGSMISAVTQLGDIAFSLYDNGIWHTAKGVKKSFSKNRITKEDLGIEQITQEFANQTKSGKALETVFKATGLNRMDRLGKETLVNGNMSKLQSWAKSGDDRLDVELNRWFDAEEAQVVKEQFRQGSLTEDTKLVLFSRLLDFQPVAKSEMPQKYLEMPNGRIFYMLKSFTIKQIDVFRREAIDDIVSGDKTKAAKGVKNMMLLAGTFVAANATADEIKDQILGRDTPMEDRIVDNMWRLVGASKYDVYKARQEGFGTTVMKKILFPASILDRGSKDVSNVLNEKTYEKGPLKGERYGSESVQSIPIAGKLYYWWFGRGAQKQEYKEGTGTTTEEGLPKLPKLPSTSAAGDLPSLPKLPKI